MPMIIWTSYCPEDSTRLKGKWNNIHEVEVEVPTVLTPKYIPEKLEKYQCYYSPDAKVRPVNQTNWIDTEGHGGALIVFHE